MEEMQLTPEQAAELAAKIDKTRESLEKTINEGTQMYEMCKTPGFALLKKQIDDKINDEKLKWLSPTITKDDAEVIRIKASVWRDIYSIIQTTIKRRTLAQDMLKKLEAGETL